eukprot:GHVS01080235.1.p1 GENE.GHVS01080235.1~~GHVS01080235.1.p1  ORF type:complete len:203 (+),score=70.69 GHVS01080235.1:345-953(+)
MAAVAGCCHTTTPTTTATPTTNKCSSSSGSSAERNKHAKDLSIRHSVVKRLVKELKFYIQEEILNKQTIEAVKANPQHVSPSGEDLTGELKRHTAVLNDTQQMLPDAQKRLVTACIHLNRMIKKHFGEKTTTAVDVVVVEEVRLTLNSVSEEFPEIGIQIDGSGGDGGDKVDEQIIVSASGGDGEKQNKKEEEEEEEDEKEI